MIFSCGKPDVPAVPYVVPYAEQYPKDIAAIDKYLDEYHMDVVNAEKDVAFTKIPTPNTANLQSIRVQYASNLHVKTVASNGVDYKVYYVNITDTPNPSNYGTGEKPTKVDSIFVSYKGQTLADVVFDQAPNPIWLRLLDVIEGWTEIFPLFKTGDAGIVNSNGTVTYNNFGAGVMFLPSGLAYYNNALGSIPAYAPLIFSFKLKALNYIDHDYDRINSKDEDINGDGNPANDDADADGFSNYLDIDDDGDAIPTKTEIKRPARDVNGDIMLDSSGLPIYVGYYPYNGAAVDDPLTLTIDETQGIPRKFTGPLRNPSLPESATNRRRPLPSDYTDPTRLRRHLDSSSRFPYEN